VRPRKGSAAICSRCHQTAPGYDQLAERRFEFIPKAVDEVRAAEARRTRREGRAPVLKKSRWPLLGRSENLDEQPLFRLPDLLRYNLKTVPYLLKEAFQQLWEYNSPAWAGKLLEEWRPKPCVLASIP